MLGKFIRVRVTQTIGSVDADSSRVYPLNFGVADKDELSTKCDGFYIMGINHPVRIFEGRVIASLKQNGKHYYIAAPKSSRFINCDIIEALKLEGKYKLDCIYERSCGAIVYRKINGIVRYLLIKNKHSANWGFPKGHVESGENSEETATREVLEETGINIDILPNFRSTSEYRLQNKVEKSVIIFLAKTDDTNTIIQPEEIDDYVWLDFDKALSRVKFENDKKILIDANEFLKGVLYGKCTV